MNAFSRLAARPTPLAEAGAHGGLTELISRGKGLWALCVLHRLLGDRLLPALRAFFDRCRDAGATLEEFQTAMVERAESDLAAFFREWLWGAGSSSLLAREMEEPAWAATLAARYEKEP